MKIGKKRKTILVKTQGRSIRMGQGKDTAKISTSKKLSFNALENLIVHEIITHTIKRTGGERSQVMLLGLGFNRYDRGEEKTATMKA